MNEFPIVLFDGECAFCNKSVLFILKHNKKENIMVCSNTSEHGKKLIRELNISADPAKTLIFIKPDQSVKIKSSAALGICKHLGGLYPVLQAFYIVPKFIRDKFYDIVAKHRYKLLSENENCSLELARDYHHRVLE